METLHCTTMDSVVGPLFLAAAGLLSGRAPAPLTDHGRAQVPGKPVRVNISIEDRLLDAVDRTARSRGQSRSAFLAEAAREKIKGAA